MPITTNLRKWLISEWHNISGSSAPIEMDGALYEDIKSIICAMMENKTVKVYQERLDALYQHLVDYNNPHHVTIDQFLTQVIDIFYRTWIKEGYSGSMEDFLEIFFRYIEIANYEELVAGESYIKVTTVADVARYIKAHDNSLHTAHVDLFNTVFPGTPPNTQPMLSCYQYLGLPHDINEKYDTTSKWYKNLVLPGLDKFMHDNFAVVMKAKLETRDYAILADRNNVERIVMRCNKETRQFIVDLYGYGDLEDSVFGFAGSVNTVFGEAPFYNPNDASDLSASYKLDLAPLIEAYPDSEYITTVISFRGPYLQLYAEPSISEYTLPIIRAVGDLVVLDEIRIPRNPHLDFSGMNLGDPLQVFELYREEFRDDILNYVFNLYR